MTKNKKSNHQFHLLNSIYIFFTKLENTRVNSDSANKIELMLPNRKNHKVYHLLQSVI